MNHRWIRATALGLLMLVVAAGVASASYGLYVGKDLTEDGSVMLSGSGDEVSGHWTMIVPAQDHEPGTMVEVGVTDEARYPGERFEIPQAPHTFRFIAHYYSNFAGFPPPLTNGGLNEHQLAARDIWSPSRSELRRMTDDPQRGLNYSDLSRMAMQRARTAEEAVDVVGELIDQHGFSTYGGNSHLFADPDEGWIVINYAGSEGLWVAERLGSNEVRLSYPGYLNPIPARYIDFENLRLRPNREYKASANFIAFAVEQGWYDPDNREPFDANTVYGNVSRERTLGVTSSSGDIVINPITGEDVTNTTIAEFEEQMRAMAPVSLSEMMALTRTPLLSRDTNGYGEVAHLRDDLAHPELATIWMAATGSITAPFVPYYIGTQEVPMEYAQHRYLYREADATFLSKDWAIQEGTDFAFRTFKQLMYFTLDRPEVFLPEVNETLVGFEADVMAEQAKVSDIATVLMSNGHDDLAREYLTDYTAGVAADALDLGEALLAGIEARTRSVYGLRRPETDAIQGGSTINGVVTQSVTDPEAEAAADELAGRSNRPAVQTMKPVYEVGEPISVVFANARGNARDWIALAKDGSGNQDFVTWQYVEGEPAGYRVFVDGLSEPGEYEARLFWDDGYDLGDSFEFTVR